MYVFHRQGSKLCIETETFLHSGFLTYLYVHIYGIGISLTPPEGAAAYSRPFYRVYNFQVPLMWFYPQWALRLITVISH